MEALLNPTQQAEKAIHTAVSWRLMGLLLERPREGWLSEIQELATEFDSGCLRQAADAAGEASEGTYLHLFGEGGFVSPREITYRPMEDPGQILGDIAGFYASFAFKPRAEDPTDHIAVESGFVGYMWLKEAHAIFAANSEAADITRSARRRFVEEHLLIVAKPWGERVQETGISYLTETARVLLDSIDQQIT